MSQTAQQPAPQRTGMHRSALLIRRDAKLSVKDGCAYSVMAGLGEQFLPAFALAAGLGEVNSGLLVTVPLLVGAVAQLLSPAGVKYLGSYRKWVVYCALLQGASFIPFVIAALVGSIPASVAFLFAGIYWGAGLSIGAAWNTWMGSVIPAQFRARFFSTRNRYIQTSGMIGFLVGGVILHFHHPQANHTFSFAAIFLFAFAARLLSAYWISEIAEPTPPKSHSIKDVSFSQFAQRFKAHDESAKLLIYMLVVQCTVYTASPFFTPYMLSKLEFNYPQFTALIVASFLAKILSLPLLGKWVARHGAHNILWIGGIGLVTSPALWLISTNFWYLLAVQAGSGFFWACFELCTVLLVIEKISESERVALLTNYNLLNAASMVLGSMLGATLLDVLGKTMGAYQTLFALSFGARMLSLYFLNHVSVSHKAGKVVLPLFGQVMRDSGLLYLPFIPKGLRRKKGAKKTGSRAA